MKRWLAPDVYASLRFKVYRYRFLLVYIVIGVVSLWIEILVIRGVQYLGLAFGPAQIVGLVASILFAFWMNARFNFKVPVVKRNRTLAYFAVISIISAAKPCCSQKR